MFKPGTLARLSPLFLQYAMLGFSSPDVMRFLAHRVNVSGEIPANYRGELTMDFKHRVHRGPGEVSDGWQSAEGLR